MRQHPGESLTGSDGRIELPKRVAPQRSLASEPPPAPRFIADEVKRLILRGQLSLGEPVTEKWMTERFRASRTTVREAISLLSAERYLEQEPYKTARVRSYSLQEMQSILEARRLLEGFAADRCDQASEESRSRLRTAFATYASETVANRNEATAIAHVDLHVAVVGLTDNPELVRAERHLMIGSLLLVDLINWQLQDSEKMYMEHLALVNALLEPDPQTARTLTDGHLNMVLGAAHVRVPASAASDEP